MMPPARMPAHRPQRTRPARRRCRRPRPTDQPPEQLAQERADHEHADQPERIERIEEAGPQSSEPCDASGRGDGSGSPSMTPIIRLMPAAMPPAKSPLLKRGVITSSMMRLRGDVGQRAFQAVADLDAQLAVVLGDDEQRAVVDLLAADLPGLRDAQRILLDGLGRRSSARSAPRSGCPCASRSRQAAASARRFAARQRAGLVDHAPD